MSDAAPLRFEAAGSSGGPDCLILSPMALDPAAPSWWRDHGRGGATPLPPSHCMIAPITSIPGPNDEPRSLCGDLGASNVVGGETVTDCSELKAQLPMLSSGSRASTPLSKEADGIRAKLEELGSDAGEVRAP